MRPLSRKGATLIFENRKLEIKENYNVSRFNKVLRTCFRVLGLQG